MYCKWRSTYCTHCVLMNYPKNFYFEIELKLLEKFFFFFQRVKCGCRNVWVMFTLSLVEVWATIGVKVIWCHDWHLTSWFEFVLNHIAIFMKCMEIMNDKFNYCVQIWTLHIVVLYIYIQETNFVIAVHAGCQAISSCTGDLWLKREARSITVGSAINDPK